VTWTRSGEAEPATAWSKVRRPKRCTTKTPVRTCFRTHVSVLFYDTLFDWNYNNESNKRWKKFRNTFSRLDTKPYCCGETHGLTWLLYQCRGLQLRTRSSSPSRASPELSVAVSTRCFKCSRVYSHVELRPKLRA